VISLHSSARTRDNKPSGPGLPPPWHPDTAAGIRPLPAGPQDFWGVPFALGSEGSEPCWLLVDRDRDAVTIPVSRAASFLIFAHLCNATPDIERPDVEMGLVTHPGEHLADYVLSNKDGSEHRRPIRRRFQVNELTSSWGQIAVSARPHPKHVPMDFRGTANRNEWGQPQTGASQATYATPNRYWIYALENPAPRRTLDCLRIEPTGGDQWLSWV
jgi:hypothetical protein